MTILANSVIIFSCLFLTLCSIAIYRSKESLLILNFVFIANFYGINLLLFGLLLKERSLIIIAQILIFMIANSIISVIIKQLLIKKIGADIDIKDAEKITLKDPKEEINII